MYSYANVHSGLRDTHGFSHSEPFNSDMAIASRESRQSFAVEWLRRRRVSRSATLEKF